MNMSSFYNFVLFDILENVLWDIFCVKMYLVPYSLRGRIAKIPCISSAFM